MDYNLLSSAVQKNLYPYYASREPRLCGHGGK